MNQNEEQNRQEQNWAIVPSTGGLLSDKRIAMCTCPSSSWAQQPVHDSLFGWQRDQSERKNRYKLHRDTSEYLCVFSHSQRTHKLFPKSPFFPPQKTAKFQILQQLRPRWPVLWPQTETGALKVCGAGDRRAESSFPLNINLLFYFWVRLFTNTLAVSHTKPQAGASCFYEHPACSWGQEWVSKVPYQGWLSWLEPCTE